MRTTFVLILAAAVGACGDQPESAAGEPADDPAFAALQERGAALDTAAHVSSLDSAGAEPGIGGENAMVAGHLPPDQRVRVRADGLPAAVG